MAYLVLLASILLFIVVMSLIYRVLSLVKIANKTSNERVGFSNKVHAALFPLFFVVGFGLIIWYSGVAKQYFLPEAASEHGVRTDFLFWVTMAIICTAFLITHVLLFFFPYLYQYRENRKAYYYPHNDKLEVVWTTIPAVVMAILVFSGYVVWSDITAESPKDATVIEILGKQFNWHVRYPGLDGQLGAYNYKKIDATNSMGVDFKDPKSLDDFMPREIHLPKGKPVRLQIRARDVIHSVFMPHFRVKMDAVPGMQTTFWFIPTKTTEEMRKELNNPNFNYELACTEVCGGGHFAMRMLIIVEEPEKFETWVKEQEPWAKQNKEYLASLGINYDKLVASKK
ncbi:MAG: cytochrome c oxidase subunit II [Cytophagales bacterium]|nr:cytochrome c oxidase subunit II [Cytophagales bacterium]MDW8384356.1 cytochrome c oxidase subunit II [Flammeovirgaceae bacterium]